MFETAAQKGGHIFKQATLQRKEEIHVVGASHLVLIREVVLRKIYYWQAFFVTGFIQGPSLESLEGEHQYVGSTLDSPEVQTHGVIQISYLLGRLPACSHFGSGVEGCS